METYQAAVDRRIRTLKKYGVNAIRTSHNPVSPEFIEACDRLGMLVFEEAFDQWLYSKNSDDYHNYLIKQQMERRSFLIKPEMTIPTMTLLI